jgi:hypothetical protein
MTEPTNEELATCEAEALDIGAAFHAFLEAKERWIDAYQKDGRDRFAALTQLIRYLIAEREASAGGPPQSVSEFKHDPVKLATVDGVAVQEETAADIGSSVNSTDDPDDV